MKIKKFNELFDTEDLRDKLGWRGIDKYDNPGAKRTNYKKRLDTANSATDISAYNNEPQAFINWLTFEFPYFMRASTLDKGRYQIFMFKNDIAFISVAFEIKSPNNIELTFVMKDNTSVIKRDLREFTNLKELSEYIRKNIIPALDRHGFKDAKKLNPSSN